MDGFIAFVKGLKGWRIIIGFLIYMVMNNNFGVEMVENALKIDTSSAADSLALLIANNIWDTFGVLALGLAIIGFLFELDRALLMSHGNVTMQTFFFPFLKLAACIAFISYGKELVSYALGLNNWMIDAAHDAITLEASAKEWGTATDQIEQAINDMNFFQAVLFVVPTLLFTWIASIIPGIIMYYNAVVRKIEILLRVGFSPVAFADIYKGWDSTAVQWLKKFIALGLYGMGMVVIMQVCMALEVGAITEAFAINPDDNLAEMALGQVMGFILPLLQVVAVMFAQIGACSMIKQVSNEVMGVR